VAAVGDSHEPTPDAGRRRPATATGSSSLTFFAVLLAAELLWIGLIVALIWRYLA
jgi:hypothetical protein